MRGKQTTYNVAAVVNQTGEWMGSVANPDPEDSATDGSIRPPHRIVNPMTGASWSTKTLGFGARVVATLNTHSLRRTETTHRR